MLLPNKKVQIVDTDHRACDRLRGCASIEREPDREHVCEADAVEDLEREHPADAGFVATGRDRGRDCQ